MDTNREIINLLRNSLHEGKQYINSLKDFVNYLKDEIASKDKEILHKNTLLERKFQTITSENDEINNLHMETRLHSTSETELPELFSEHDRNVLLPLNHFVSSQDDNSVFRVPLDEPSAKDNIYYSNKEDDDILPNVIDSKWITDNRRERIRKSRINEIPLSNRYNSLEVEDDNPIDEYANDNNDDDKVINTKTRSRPKANLPNKRNVSSFFLNKHPEKDVLLSREICKERPGKHDVRKRKIAIISDSITRPIDMREFDDLVNNGVAIKRAYGGATASRLNFYVKGMISEDKPDTIIICGGTNNLTEKSQSAEEIADEILEIVNTCRRKGVGNIYVSSLTCRPDFQTKNRRCERKIKILCWCL